MRDRKQRRMAERWVGRITVRPRPDVGAEIERVDLRQPLTTELCAVIYQDHGAVFLRDQDITREQHLPLGKLRRILSAYHGNRKLPQ